MAPPIQAPQPSPALGSFPDHFTDVDLHNFSWQLDDHQGNQQPGVAAHPVASALGSVPVQAHPIDNSAPTNMCKPEEPGSDDSVSDDANDANPEIAQAQKVQARSERKRSREKQRRANVNQQFSDLSSLLQKIDLAEKQQTSPKDTPVIATPTSSSVQTNNRVDLIARTIQVMERIFAQNTEKIAEIESLKKSVENANKIAQDTAVKLKEATLYQTGGSAQKQQVMMMVPMMVSSDGSAQTPGAAATSMQYPMQSPHPYMTPQSMGYSMAAPGMAQQQPATQPQLQHTAPQQQMQQMQMPQNQQGMFAPMMFHHGMAAAPQGVQQAAMTTTPQAQQGVTTTNMAQQSNGAPAPAPAGSTTVATPNDNQGVHIHADSNNAGANHMHAVPSPMVGVQGGGTSLVVSAENGGQQQQQPPQQQTGKWGVQNNLSGGNLAHCA